MSPSSAAVTYRPEGAGQKLRQARFDLSLIPDPQAWLTRRVGALAAFALELPARPAISDADRLGDLTGHLHAAMARQLATRKAALDAVAERLAAVAPVMPADHPNPPSQPERSPA